VGTYDFFTLISTHGFRCDEALLDLTLLTPTGVDKVRVLGRRPGCFCGSITPMAKPSSTWEVEFVVSTKSRRLSTCSPTRDKFRLFLGLDSRSQYEVDCRRFEGDDGALEGGFRMTDGNGVVPCLGRTFSTLGFLDLAAVMCQ